jgi:DNA-binding transcriptional MerR regulator
MKNSNNKPVSIGEAARATKVSVKQIRHWHEQGYIPAPERVVCGERSYRYFNDNDLRIISRIKAYLDQGFTLLSAARKTQQEFNY